MNDCLGMFKSRPLLPTNERYLSFHDQERRIPGGALLLADLEQAPDLSARFPLWAAYARSLPTPLVLERRLTSDDNDNDERLERLPVMRLRRLFLTQKTMQALHTHEPAHLQRIATTLGGDVEVDDLDVIVRDCIRPLLCGSWEQALWLATDPDYTERFEPLIRRMAVVSQAWAGLEHDWLQATYASVAHQHTILMRTALWRVAAATWVGHQLLPPVIFSTKVGGGVRGGCAYQAQLLIDTHLAFFGAAFTHRRIDDAFYLSAGASCWSQVYPLPHRVCCAEELPDLTPYLLHADLAFDSGRGKKPRTQQQAVIHIFLCKMMNNICHIRHLPGAIAIATATYPVVRELFALVVRTMLLGNVPEAVNRLGLAARIRVQVEFVPDPLAVAGASGTTGPDMQQIVTWARRRKYLSLFLLREYFIYTILSDGVFDRHLSTRQEWSAYKKVVGLANQVMRDEVTRQCIERIDREHIEWAFMDPYGTAPLAKADLAAAWHRLGPHAPTVAMATSRTTHALALSACQKISKGRPEFLIPKKMVPNEMDILRHHADARLGSGVSPLCVLFKKVDREPLEATATADALEETMQRLHLTHLPEDVRQRMLANAQLTNEAGQLTLADLVRRHVIETEVLPPVQRHVEELADVFHVVAWAAARELNDALRDYVQKYQTRRPPVVALRYLEWLGFTPEQMASVRQWVYLYSMHDVADNKFKRQTCDFGRAHLAAFFKLKHYFRLVDMYRKEDRTMLLSAEMTADTYQVLRKRLRIADYEATVPLLGKAVLCGGCNRWATPVKPAPIWIECRNDARMLGQRIRNLEKKQKQANGRAARIDEYLREPIELGAVEGWTSVDDGEPYCRHGKYTKDVLTAQRERARRYKSEDAAAAAAAAAAAIANQGSGAAGDDDDDDDESASDSDDEEEEEEVDNEDDDDGSGQGEVDNEEDDEYHADRLFLELIEPTAMHINPENVRIPSRFGRAVSGGDAAAAAVPAHPADPPPQKKRNQELRKETTRMLLRTMAPLLKPRPRMVCRSDPMLTVDMVGIWFARGDGDLYGLCVYCGDLTTVRNEKIMSRGLSCMNHPHAGAFPLDHHQTLATLPLLPPQRTVAAAAARAPMSALQTQRAQLQMAKQASPVMDLRERLMERHPHVLDGVVHCMYCNQYLTRSVIRLVDVLFQTVEMALCDVCLGVLRSFGSTQAIGHRGAHAMAPMDMGIVLRELGKAAGTRRQRRRRQMLQARAAAAAAAAATPATTPSVDEAFLALVAGCGTVVRRLARLVRAHPHFQTLLQTDSEAHDAYYLNVGGRMPAAERVQLATLRQLADKLARRQ